MLTKAVAKSSFYHGNKQYQVGSPVEVTKGEAHDLERDGLVDIAGDAEQNSQAEPEQKMAEPLENKMLDTPANKSRVKKQ